jgi:peptidoglycan hydrolase CwlO-like protein
MGEYERVYKIIAELKKEKKEIVSEIERLKEILEELESIPGEERLCKDTLAKIDSLYERLWETNVEIGECEGYIRELEYIDGEDY